MTRIPARRRTLQVRLTVGMIGLLVAAGVTIAIATVIGVSAFLVDQLDAQLATSGQRYEEYLRTDERDEEGRTPASPDRSRTELGEVPGLPAGTMVVRLDEGRAVDGYVIAEGPVTLGPDDTAALADVPPGVGPRSVELAGGRYRVASSTSGPDDVLVVGIPLDELDDAVARVLAVEAVVFVVVIAVVGTAGALFVGRSLSPLHRVASTATRVAEAPLGAGPVAVPERVVAVDPSDEVGQVGVALNLLLDHVEASFGQRQATEERLRRFVADASHELRTPVAVISGYAQLAQRDADSLPAAVAQALDRIGSQSAHMSVLVDDLLLLARLDAGRPLAADPVDLTRLVLDVVEDARAAGQDHRWLLELPEEPIVVVGDAQRLRQVLANLTSNARVHTPAGTTVTTSLSTEDPDRVLLSVTDDGPGIPADLQPELFHRFVRGEASRSGSAGSTGLGLSIVEAVVAAHGGTVQVHSEPARTTFTVRLPVGRR